MSSTYFGNDIVYQPTKKSLKKDIEMNEYGFGYPLERPTIIASAAGEEYYPQTVFSWTKDSIVMHRKNEIRILRKDDYTELLAKDKDGNEVWLDGRSAPYEDIYEGEYLHEYRDASKYTIISIDILNNKKTIYKCIEEKTEQISDKEIISYIDSEFKDVESLKKLEGQELEKRIAKLDDDNLWKLFYDSQEDRANKEKVIKLASVSRLALKFAIKELQNDKEVVLAAVKKHGAALQFASDELKSDKEIVKAALKNNLSAILYMPKESWNDKEIVFQAIRMKGFISSFFKFVSKELRSDKEFVLSIVGAKQFLLQYVSEELKNDKDVVLAAVKEYGLALQYASERLRGDKDVVLAAIQQDANAIRYALNDIKDDKDVVIKAIQQSKQFYSVDYLSDKLKLDKDVELAAVYKYLDNLKNVPKELLKDNDFIEKVLKEYEVSAVIHVIPETICANKEYVLSAIKEDSYIYNYLPDELKLDKQVIIEALNNGLHSFTLLEDVPDEIKTDKEVAIAAVYNDWQYYNHLPEKLKKDADIIEAHKKSIENSKNPLPF